MSQGSSRTRQIASTNYKRHRRIFVRTTRRPKKREQDVLDQSIVYHQVSCQGLAFRGYKDDSDSNFVQLLKLRSSDDPRIRTWMKRTKDFTSPELQNEFLKVMSNEILRKQIKQIQQAQFFTTMADETVDSSNKEQLVICLRWVDVDFEPHEIFFGMYHIDNTEASTIFNAIKDVFQRFNLSFDRIRGQCYDMAASMARSKSGVAFRIKSIEKRAVYMHCYGHVLNLACNDAIGGCRTKQNAQENTREITKLIKLSPRRDTIFKKIKNALEHSDSPGIRILCPTRWTVRAEALYSIIETYDVLQEVWVREESLEYVKEQEMRSRIRGVALYMQTFDFLFGSIVGETILRNCDNLSKALQKESVTAAEGKKMATLTVQTLQTTSMRNDEQFALFWEKLEQ